MRAKSSDTKLVNLFLDMLAAEQGAGANTLDAYRRDLNDLSEFLASNSQDFVGAETQALRNYLSDLDTRGFKSSSLARRLSAMRHLFRFLLNERIRPDDPAAILSGPKRGRGLPKVLSIACFHGPKRWPRPRNLRHCGSFAHCGCIACSRYSMRRACGFRNW